MAELADALDLGSSGRPCRFKSCYPHFAYDTLYRVSFFRKHRSDLPYLKQAYVNDGRLGRCGSCFCNEASRSLQLICNVVLSKAWGFTMKVSESEPKAMLKRYLSCIRARLASKDRRSKRA